MPVSLIISAMALFVAFIAGGGIYDLVENPPAIIPSPGGGWIAINPFLGEQTLNESLVSMVLILTMFIGMFIAYKSTKVTYDYKRANTMLILGISLILLGLAGGHYLMILKRTASI